MPAHWPIQGNTGYDFLATVNNLLNSRKGEAKLAAFYQKLLDDNVSMPEQVEAKKRAILTRHMGGEWDNLTHYFLSLNLVKDKHLLATTFTDIKLAIGEFLIACPVYRYYGNCFPLGHAEASAIARIFKQSKKSKPALTIALELLEDALLKYPAKKDEAYGQRALQFYQRCMQFTGPLMAKGVEDTLMYTNNHFIAHNEVGDSPEALGISVKEFHNSMIARQRDWPLSVNGTATHDTKRGEDVRARLQVLPDMAAEWLQTIQSWQHINADLKQNQQPDINDEYFIYQTLIGAYPMPGQTDANLAERLNQYLEKTLREGKQNSDWAQPNHAYETATKAFVKQLLNKRGLFFKSFTALHHKVAGFGVVNSLAQVLLKFTCPGVPDVYQGCEHWDLSLVDPDNRRPVDYALRKKLLTASPKKLWENKFNGQVKLWLTNILAAERRQHEHLFTVADYVPLQVSGKFKNHVLAFARRHQHCWYLTVIPLGLAAMANLQGKDIDSVDWDDTRIILPNNTPANFVDILSGNKGTLKKEPLVKDLFSELPLAFLKLQQPENKRSAGILLAMSSLPSPFGIGDMGPGARAFADILHRSGQKYWQLLPLSPVSALQQFSPYSSYASFAGNEWYISPELLVTDGLLTQQNIDSHALPELDKTDYETAGKIKQELFDIAWTNFKTGKATQLKKPFAAYCKAEAYWLDDYALYAQLRQYHYNQPWHTWPDEYKLRDMDALKAFAKLHADGINKTKWLQFIFARQWEQLKVYCHKLGVHLFGDLPFYVSYDSADVWANRELFSLDESGAMLHVAGVPPDYFNADGQLWGMPVFCWDKLQAQNFDWWIKRVKKNLQYFDLLRLDHFRAFASYWAVPAHETTAINGQWETAPGQAFFEALKKELGSLPLVAEDLGDIDDTVYQLRDEFGLPGMKVLQFAWGDTLATSPHIAHNFSDNFIAYTGTHDNNTTKGWYRQDIDKAVRKQIKSYIGHKVNADNVNAEFIKMALASVADTVIVPLQDWLGLDESARMNTPAAIENNWLWRITTRQLKKLPEKKMRKWIARYNR
jgi:4-alpha-glucanotransferase